MDPITVIIRSPFTLTLRLCTTESLEEPSPCTVITIGKCTVRFSVLVTSSYLTSAYKEDVPPGWIPPVTYKIYCLRQMVLKSRKILDLSFLWTKNLKVYSSIPE